MKMIFTSFFFFPFFFLLPRYLFERMKEIDVYDKVDVIVLSDHGVTDTPLDKIVRMQDYDLNFASIFNVCISIIIIIVIIFPFLTTFFHVSSSLSLSLSLSRPPSLSQTNDPTFNTSGLDGWCVACGAVATFIPFEGKEEEIYLQMSNIPGIQSYTNVSIEEQRPDWFVFLFFFLSFLSFLSFSLFSPSFLPSFLKNLPQELLQQH